MPNARNHATMPSSKNCARNPPRLLAGSEKTKELSPLCLEDFGSFCEASCFKGLGFRDLGLGFAAVD